MWLNSIGYYFLPSKRIKKIGKFARYFYLNGIHNQLDIKFSGIPDSQCFGTPIFEPFCTSLVKDTHSKHCEINRVFVFLLGLLHPLDSCKMEGLDFSLCITPSFFLLHVSQCPVTSAWLYLVVCLLHISDLLRELISSLGFLHSVNSLKKESWSDHFYCKNTKHWRLWFAHFNFHKRLWNDWVPPMRYIQNSEKKKEREILNCM